MKLPEGSDSDRQPFAFRRLALSEMVPEFAAPEDFAAAVVLRNAAVQIVNHAARGADDPAELARHAIALCDQSERLLDTVMAARRRATFRVLKS
jgi:hypothetical protein